MSNFNKVKLLSGRTSGVPSVIFFLICDVIVKIVNLIKTVRVIERVNIVKIVRLVNLVRLVSSVSVHRNAISDGWDTKW